MSVQAVTHLNFRGDARQALEFYHSVFGGELVIATYADFGAPQEAPNAAQVVWGQVAADSGFRVMAYDVPMAAHTSQPSAPTTAAPPVIAATSDAGQAKSLSFMP